MFLPEDNEVLRTIIQESPSPISLYIGPEMKILVANKAIISAWGKDESVIGKPIAEAIPELAGQPFPRILQQVFSTGEAYSAKEDPVQLIINGELRSFYFDFTYKPLKDASGKVWGILNNATNVTELVLARKKIAASESRFRKMVAEAPVAIGILSGREFMIESANNEMLSLWGRQSDVIGSSLLEALPEIQGQPFIGLLEEVYRTGDSLYGNEVFTILEREGHKEELYFNFVYAPVRDETEQITGIMVVATEVTGQVRASMKLKESEQRFRSLIEDAPMATAIFEGKDMVISMANDAMFRAWGKEPSVTGKKLLEAVPELAGQPFLPILEHVFNSGIPYHADQQKAHFEVDGVLQPFWFNFTYQPLYDKDGQVYGILEMAADVSKQVQLQKQKDDFLGIASHELKTPVTSLKAYIQILEMILSQEAGDTRKLHMVRSMNAQVTRLTSLIEDLLDVTKIQSGKLRFNEQPFEFAAMLKEAVEDIRLSMDKHELVLQNDAQGYVMADRERIGQVVANLLSNAAKYAPQSEKIIIHSSNEDGQIILCVEDFGIGIPEDKTERVFEQFYRVSGKLQHTFPGLGLGLYISAEIIRNQGGRIWVNSVEGKGSRFYFSLPLSEQPVEAVPDSTFP